MYASSTILSLSLLAASFYLSRGDLRLMSSSDSRSHSRHIEMVNESGDRIAIDWLDPATGEAVPVIPDAGLGEHLELDSWVNHSFALRLLSNDSNTTEQTTTIVTVAEDKEDQVYLIKKGLKVEHFDLTSTAPTGHAVARMAIQTCHEKAINLLSSGLHIETVKNTLSTCVEEQVTQAFQQKNEELLFQNLLLRELSHLTENYTCADPDMVTSTPKEIRTWTHQGEVRQVGILHERAASQIHIIQDFISPEECEAIKTAAVPSLHRGTVADGKGGSRLSENRKAWQAGIAVDYSNENDPIAAVKRRLFDYANYATGYGLALPGQEDIMSIQYFGNGENDPTPDRYTPHCDGECTGRPAKKGARVATMVMYCDIPELGGATNFQNANVYVKPQAGAAAFFSYMDPVSGNHEDGFTSHSGCPVLKGTKRIAVQWMRIGVSDEDPWDSFDTNTISKKEASFYVE